MINNKNSKFFRSTLVVLALVGIISMASVSVAEAAWTSQVLTYANGGGSPKLKLNLIRPTSGGPYPVIIWIHGGPFKPGGTDASAGYETYFTDAGYAIANVGYRAQAQGLWPKQPEDVKGAIRFLRANAAAYNINPDMIGIFGSSSGGMIASYVGTTGNDPLLEGTTGGNLAYSSAVDAVVNISGSYTIEYQDSVAGDIMKSIKGIVGCALAAPCPEKVALSSQTHIDAGDAMFQLIHGSIDDKVFPIQAETLYNSLNEYGRAVPNIIMEGYGHESELMMSVEYPVVIDFFDTYLVD